MHCAYTPVVQPWPLRGATVHTCGQQRHTAGSRHAVPTRAAALGDADTPGAGVQRTPTHILPYTHAPQAMLPPCPHTRTCQHTAPKNKQAATCQHCAHCPANAPCRIQTAYNVETKLFARPARKSPPRSAPPKVSRVAGCWARGHTLQGPGHHTGHLISGSRGLAQGPGLKRSWLKRSTQRSAPRGAGKIGAFLSLLLSTPQCTTPHILTHQTGSPCCQKSYSNHLQNTAAVRAQHPRHRPCHHRALCNASKAADTARPATAATQSTKGCPPWMDHCRDSFTHAINHRRRVSWRKHCLRAGLCAIKASPIHPS